jgi:hypothetical protein
LTAIAIGPGERHDARAARFGFAGREYESDCALIALGLRSYW